MFGITPFTGVAALIILVSLLVGALAQKIHNSIYRKKPRITQTEPVVISERQT